jgi:hypothetical protein
MDTKLIEKFNTQLNQEFYSAYLYFAMATYFDEIAMIGFSKFMKHKASEKLSDHRFCAGYIFQQPAAIHLRLYWQLQCNFCTGHCMDYRFTGNDLVAENLAGQKEKAEYLKIKGGMKISPFKLPNFEYVKFLLHFKT